MTATATENPAAHGGGAGADAQAPGLLERLSDRLNPILVREVQQSTKGKLFAISLWVALAAIVLTALVFALLHSTGNVDGSDALRVTVGLLVVVLGFIVPVQAFLSMRQEMIGSTAEQLLLSRLRPGAVVRGKIAGATIQTMLWVAVFGPLLALTFLLRGVDVVLIGVTLSYAVVFGISQSAFAVMMGSFCRNPIVNLLVTTLTTLILASSMTSALPMAVSAPEIFGELTRLSAFFEVFTSLLVATLVGALVAGLVATTMLQHPYENRSTKFRLLLPCVCVLGYLLLWWAVEPRYLDDALPALAIGLQVFALPFLLLAATERERLSPRVAAHLPESGPGRLLAVPLLPGGARGLLFGVLFLTFLHGLLAAVAYLTGVRPDGDGVRVSIGIGLSLVAYNSIARLLSLWFGRPWLARVLIFAVLFLACVLPLFGDLIVQGTVSSWHPLHTLNPFFTVAEIDSRNGGAPLMSLVLVAGLLFAVNLLGIVAGIGEPARCARARDRQRAAAVRTEEVVAS